MPRYVPRPLSQGTPAFTWPVPHRGEVDELVWEALVYAAEPGYRPLFLDVRVPAPGAPLVLALHGGGWMLGSRRRLSANVGRHWFVERLLLAGVAVALVDVRLAREAAMPAPVADVRAAVRWLRAHAAELGLDGGRVALWGESAGAHLALMAATCDRPLGPPGGRAEHLDQREDVSAVAAWYGPAELSGDRELVTGGWDAAAVSPITYARRDVPPILLVHGRDDDVVPVSQSRAYHAALAAADADVEYLETGGGHVFDGSDAMEEAVTRTVAFLAGRLGAPGPASAAPAPERRVVAGGAEAVRAAVAAEVDHVIAALDAGDAESRAAVHRLREAGVAVTLRIFPAPDPERARRWLEHEVDRLSFDGPW